MSLITPAESLSVFMITGASAEPPIGGEGSRLLLGWWFMTTWSITMPSGSLSGRSALAFLGPRFAAFLCFNLGTGVPSSGVTGLMETMSGPPPTEVEGRGAADDVVSACPFLAGAAPATWLSTSSRA